MTPTPKEKKEIGKITIDEAIEAVRKQQAEEKGEKYIPKASKFHTVDKNGYTYKKLESIEDIAIELHTKRSLYDTNEEATKQGLILPLLQYVGYDTENVNEVYPEYPIQDGRVDYVLKIAGEIRHVFEAKRLHRNLYRQISQLENYFNEVATSTLGILSDGNHYLFFSDMENAGTMDKQPFLTICLNNNFRNDRVRILLDCYKLTRFDEHYLESQLNTNNSDYIIAYGKLQKEINTLELTEKERKGIAYYLPTLLLRK